MITGSLDELAPDGEPDDSLIDRIVLRNTALVLIRGVGPPDDAVISEDGFAFAYRRERGAPRVEHDPMIENESSAVVYTRDLGPDDRIIVGGLSVDAAQRAERRLLNAPWEGEEP
jgi:hypothetical protein